MLAIEEKYLPAMQLLQEPSFLKTIKKEFKGFITASNTYFLNPKVLFIGINPGGGAYKEMNQQKGAVTQYPERLFTDNKTIPNDWLKDGNARDGFLPNKKWKNYKWHERNAPVNNEFPKRLVEFFFSYYNLNKHSDFAEIENKINSEVFYYKLYPIATTTAAELNTILKKMVEKKINLNGKDIRSMKDLKNFFRQRTIDLIQEIQPEVIICLGKQAFKELTFSNPVINSEDATKRFDIKFRIKDQKHYPVYVVSRNGNWQSRIKKLGKHLNQR